MLLDFAATFFAPANTFNAHRRGHPQGGSGGIRMAFAAPSVAVIAALVVSQIHEPGL
jgi:hypothetical protein